MKLETFAEILARFPHSAAHAKTVDQLAEEWPFGTTPVAKKRQLYNHIKELSEDSPIGHFIRKIPRPESAGRDDASRVYLDLAEISSFFMTDSVALQLLLGRGAISPLLTSAVSIDPESLGDLALARLESSRSNAARLANKLRIVPDGYPRLPAKIDSNVMRVLMEGLARKRKVEFEYCSFAGRKSRKTMGPLAIVGKDGTLYLIGLQGLESQPGVPLALHRMTQAKLTLQPFHHARFDLDEWLDKTGGLYHPLDGPDRNIVLELSVSPIAIRHFEERPLGVDQKITGPYEPDGWFNLTVTTKRWYTLTSFLIGFGPHVKVLGPAEVLAGDQGILAWAKGIAKLYPEAV